MTMKHLFSAVALLAMAATPVSAASLLHPMFTSHAVLQRDRPINVYGDTRPGDMVTVAMAGKQATALADEHGHWRAELPAPPAGGPYTLTASDSSGARQQVDDVLVGDVFLCTGQSNMQFTVAGAQNARAEIAAATDDQVRELDVERVASTAPLSTFTKPVEWKVESPQTAGGFSASCFFMARELRHHIKVPIGMVVAAWGGTRIRGWVSEPVLRRLGDFNDALDMLDLYRRDPAAAGQRWNTVWEKWWLEGAKDKPWTSDMANWLRAPDGLGAWYDWPGLSLPDGSAEAGVGFVGQLWLGTHVNLTAEQAAKGATLDLGSATEEEISWVNGAGVGGSSLAPAATHRLPPGLLHAGNNTDVTNIFCSWKNCGLSGPGDSRAIRFDDGTSVTLAGPWFYQPVKDRIAVQLPWGPMHGITQQYNGMISPIGPYSFRAAVWYQGESNIYFAPTYQKALTALMADWRAQFGAALPFLIVQIPQYGPFPTKPTASFWSDVREAQRRAAEADSNAALTVTIDIGNPKVLHPTNKQEVGRRLAIAARHLTYGEKIAPSGPRAISASREKNRIAVRFADVTGGLVSYSGAPTAFELCGATQQSCRFVSAAVHGDLVLLPGSTEATRVRYCWGDSPICTLTDASALPAGPFELPVARN
jgi:sialate O-acetylesterase